MSQLTSLITVLLYLTLSLPAQEKNWEIFDSLAPKTAAAESDAQVIYEAMLRATDLWNQHDIEGYLEAYWKSPELVVIINLDQFNGWHQLHDSYIHSYQDGNAMGSVTLDRVQIKMLRPDVACAVIWKSITCPESKKKIVGNTTSLLQKFENGWKITSSHSCTAEL